MFTSNIFLFLVSFHYSCTVWDKRPAGQRGPVFTECRHAGPVRRGKWARSSRIGHRRPEAKEAGARERSPSERPGELWSQS